MDEPHPLAGARLVVLGCGYLGSAVARVALSHGARVTGLTRNETTAAALRAEGIEVIVGDLATDVWHDQIPGGADFLLNCVSSGGAGLAGYRRSYVDGMRSTALWAQRQGRAGTAVYTSSTSVYPQGDGGAVNEASRAEGGGERSEILQEAERVLSSARAAWGRWFVLRLAGIYGPNRHHLLDQVRSREIAGWGQHRLNLIHRDDAVTAILHCFAAPLDRRDEIFNVADDAPAPKADVVAWLAERMGWPAPRFLGDSVRPDADRGALRRASTPDRVILNAKLKTRLGWSPRYPSFRAGYESFLSR